MGGANNQLNRVGVTATLLKIELVAAWRSGNEVCRINDVTVRRARLVLGWVTCPGSTPEAALYFGM